MKLAFAQEQANRLLKYIAPACERAEIGGGVLRLKPEPHDIEIICKPRIGKTRDMFGLEIGTASELDDVLASLCAKGILSKNPDNVRPAQGPRYKKFQIIDVEMENNEPQPLLDMFIVLPGFQEWGVIMTLRTGPDEFNKWLVRSRAENGLFPPGYKQEDGVVYKWQKNPRYGHFEWTRVPMPEEIDYLRFLGLPWIEPWDRVPRR